VVAESRHYPYGVERWSSGTLPTDYRFTGQRFEAGLGIYVMGVRWYDSALSRWLSADTLVPEPGNPQAFNRYSYVLGNPLRFVDQTGHFKQKQLEKWFGLHWRKLFDAIWQDLLLAAEFGDVILYGDNLSAMFVQTEGGGLTTWSMSTSDEFSGRGEISFLGSVANSDVTGLYRSTRANMEGGSSKGHVEGQYATDARFREFDRIMAWDKNAPGSITLGYDWYRSPLTNQNISMRTKFCGFSAGFTDYARLGLEGAALWGGRQLFSVAVKKGVQALAVEVAGVLGGPVAVAVLGVEVYSWTTWDTGFGLNNNGTGLPPVMPVPTP
jgi:RHS repeat-associated protein